MKTTADRTPAHNTGLAKVAVLCSADTFVVNQSWFSASTFVVKIATFAKPAAVTSHFKMTRMLKYLILSIPLYTILSFQPRQNYKPIYVHITGTLYDFKTNKPLKKYPIFLSRDKIRNLTFHDDDILIQGKTNTRKNGKFVLNTWLNKKDPTFWLLTKDFAQIKFVGIDTAKIKYGDTINIGEIWLVSYDNELIEERHNVPTVNRKKEKNVREKYSLTEIKTLFFNDQLVKRMALNSIDTTIGLISRINFGPNKPRGTIIQSYKTLTFQIDLQH